MISLKLSIDNFRLLLLLGARERMTTQFAAERIANLRDNLDFRRVIIFRVFELLHGVLVIDRVGRTMYQVTCIIADCLR